jgi:hypothetical protein
VPSQSVQAGAREVHAWLARWCVQQLQLAGTKPRALQRAAAGAVGDAGVGYGDAGGDGAGEDAESPAESPAVFVLEGLEDESPPDSLPRLRDEWAPCSAVFGRAPRFPPPHPLADETPGPAVRAVPPMTQCHVMRAVLRRLPSHLTAVNGLVSAVL